MPGLKQYKVFCAVMVVLTVGLVACTNSSFQKSDSSSTKSLISMGPKTASVPVQPNSTLPFCGNGIKEGVEKCDGGACCDSACQFKTAEDICDFVTGRTCNGSTETCPSTTAGIKYFAANDGASACAASGQFITSPAPSVSAWPTPPAEQPSKDAQFISQSTLLISALPGQSVSISFTLKNTGTIPWSYADGFYLDLSNPGIIHQAFNLKPGEVIAGGATRTFSGTFIAPASGSYQMGPQMAVSTLTGPSYFGAQSTLGMNVWGGGGGGGGSICPGGGICPGPFQLPADPGGDVGGKLVP